MLLKKSLYIVFFVYFSLTAISQTNRPKVYFDKSGRACNESISSYYRTETDTSGYYWNNHNPGAVNQLNIDADINREIIIDCKVYRIVSIVETNPPANPVAVGTPAVMVGHTTWIITVDRAYEGADFNNMIFLFFSLPGFCKHAFACLFK